MNESSGNERANLVADICMYLQEIHPCAASLQDLSRRFHISPFHLQRTFKSVTGITPRQFSDKLRIEDFKAQVREGERITDAILAAGYGSSSRLYERSDENLGMTPTTYKRRGAGMTMFYSVVACPLGYLLVAATDRGICKLSLGDDADALIANLEAEFADAERLRDDEGVGFWTERIIAFLEGWQPDLDLPLDLRATAFQVKVWQQLQKIPSRRNAELQRYRRRHRPAYRRPRGCQRLRQQSGRAGHPLPSHHPQGSQPGWLPLGHRAQTGSP